MGNGVLRVVAWVLLAGLAPAGTAGARFDPAAARRFDLTASRYRFEPARIEVEEGDVVELALRSADTDHGIAIQAYGVHVAIPEGGEIVGVSFVASRTGTFPFECSEYCGSGHRRMKGELVVAEKKG